MREAKMCFWVSKMSFLKLITATLVFQRFIWEPSAMKSIEACEEYSRQEMSKQQEQLKNDTEKRTRSLLYSTG